MGRIRNTLFLVMTLMILAWVAVPQSASAAMADWTGYLFGATHSSFNAAATAITPANAATLTAKWNWVPDPPTEPGQPGQLLFASPTVANGVVYIGADTGDFYALNESDGTVKWKVALGWQPALTCDPMYGIISTATVSPDPATGVSTVYVAGGDGYLYALDADTGNVVWKSVIAIPSTTENDYYDYSSPSVANGRIYIGVSSGCDHPLVRAGVKMFDQATGTTLATYFAMPMGETGASVWSSVAVSGNSVFVTTGNSAHGSPDPGDSISIVRLSVKTLRRIAGWQVPGSPNTDDDFGGSPTVFTATIAGQTKKLVGACNKTGDYYAMDVKNVAAGPVWDAVIGLDTGAGKCLAAAIWDGNHLFAASNGTTIGGQSSNGSIRELDPATGTFLWELGLKAPVFGSPALNGSGVIAVATFAKVQPQNNILSLVNAGNGQVLKSIALGSPTFSQPVFAQNMLFVAPTVGGLTSYAPAG